MLATTAEAGVSAAVMSNIVYLHFVERLFARQPTRREYALNCSDPRPEDLAVTLANLIQTGRRPTLEPGARRRCACAAIGRRLGRCRVGLALALVSGMSPVYSTLAQTTPESLIGGAVSDMGPYYQDLSRRSFAFAEEISMRLVRCWRPPATRLPNCRPSR